MSNKENDKGIRRSRTDALLSKGLGSLTTGSLPESFFTTSSLKSIDGEFDDEGIESYELVRVRSHERPDRLMTQIVHRKASLKFIQLHLLDGDDDDPPDATVDESLHLSSEASLDESNVLNMSQKEVLRKETDFIRKIMKQISVLEPWVSRWGQNIEVRLRDVSFYVPVEPTGTKRDFIRTVWNQSFCYLAIEFLHRFHKVTQHKRRCSQINRLKERGDKSYRSNRSSAGENGADAEQKPDIIDREEDINEASLRLFPKAYKPVLTDVNVCLQPGKMYLVLGAPGSGKTTFLKAIAGLLPNYRLIAGKNKGKPRRGLPYTDGSVEYNGLTMEVNILSCCEADRSGCASVVSYSRDLSCW